MTTIKEGGFTFHFQEWNPAPAPVRFDFPAPRRVVFYYDLPFHLPDLWPEPVNYGPMDFLVAQGYTGLIAIDYINNRILWGRIFRHCAEAEELLISRQWFKEVPCPFLDRFGNEPVATYYGRPENPGLFMEDLVKVMELHRGAPSMWELLKSAPVRPWPPEPITPFDLDEHFKQLMVTMDELQIQRERAEKQYFDWAAEWINNTTPPKLEFYSHPADEPEPDYRNFWFALLPPMLVYPTVSTNATSTGEEQGRDENTERESENAK